MRFPRILVMIALALVSTTAVFAEDAPEALQLTPEHKELAKWLGTWTGSGEIKPGPFGPGGKMEWTEKCSWFEGSEFHVVCKSQGDSPMGPSKGLGVIGYDAGKKVYTHYGVDTHGWSGFAEGTRSGDTWTYKSTEIMEGTTFHSRFTVTMNSPKEMSFTWSMSEDGENWMDLMDGVSTKK